MKKNLLFQLFFLAGSLLRSQSVGPQLPLNLDFEVTENGKPIGWQTFGQGNYKLHLDSSEAKNGKYSACIESEKDGGNFYAWAFDLPENYNGKRITLTGYIKAQNVNDGYAGLWMRIDPQIAFDNMEGRGVKGTSDWKLCEVTLKMDPEKTKKIVIGGLLVGRGKMWIDGLSVSVDGKHITLLKPYAKKLYKAERDTSFNRGSGIQITSLSKEQIQNLKVLGIIWGYLKYYHPTVAKGELNWDYELFRFYPEYIAVKNNTERDQLLVKWITSLGSFKEGKEKEFKAAETKILPDLDWLEKSGFSSELTTLLLKVKNAKRENENYYIDMYPGVGNPEFKNENEYATMKFPDPGFRLLAAYRYWNMIQYFFPYRNLIEEDWKSVLEEFIPKVMQAANAGEYTLAMLEMIGHVHDSHASIWDNNKVLREYRGNYAPVEITFVENKPVVTDYYHEQYGKESGLQKGDVIVSVNGKSTEDMVKEMLKYNPASNYPTQLRNISRNLLRSKDTVLNVEFSRQSKILHTALKIFPPDKIKITQKFDGKDTCFKMLSNEIAYINNGSVKIKQLQDVWKQVEKSKGLIIDIRNYPSDFVIYALSNFMMPESKPFVKFSSGSIENPGLFTFTKELYAGRKNKNPYTGKVVLIVNEITQSSAEFHAMAYRTYPNATVIGSTTAGADGNVSAIRLPGAISTMISGIGVYYPDGRETQRVGIVPDIIAQPTIEGIRQGKDEVLEKALQLFSK